MKKLFLLSLIAGTGISAFAQRTAHFTAGSKRIVPQAIGAKTTAVGDTFALSHIAATDTITLYYTGMAFDSGIVSGTDAYGDKGFAERYDFSAADSTLKVIGVIARFGGTIDPASTKTVTFNVWDAAAKSIWIAPNIYNSGFPNAVLTSLSKPVTQLGIALASTDPDTSKLFWFATPTAYLKKSFFVGYTINYTWATIGGDTLGLYTNKDGDRTQALYTISGTDTTVNNINATMYDDNTWHDNGEDNFLLRSNYEIFPVVKVGPGTASVKGVTRNDFTFYGSYPNPANTQANIRFSLAKNAGVTVELMDMSGRVINTISENNLAAGEHTIALSTANLAAGEYVYLVRTSSGDGAASTFTVAK